MLYTWELSARRIRKNQETIDNAEPEKRVRLFRPFQVKELFFLKSIPKRTLTDEDKKVWKLTRKLQHRYTGPHMVIEVKNPVIYKCMVNGKERMVHASKMKRDPSSNRPFEVWEDDIIDLEFNIEREHEDMQDANDPNLEADDFRDDDDGEEEDDDDVLAPKVIRDRPKPWNVIGKLGLKPSLNLQGKIRTDSTGKILFSNVAGKIATRDDHWQDYCAQDLSLH